MKYRYIVTAIALLAFNHTKASPINNGEDSEESRPSFVLPNDLKAALNGMREACTIQNREASFQLYHHHLLVFMELYPKYNIDNEAAQCLMWNSVSSLLSEK